MCARGEAARKTTIIVAVHLDKLLLKARVSCQTMILAERHRQIYSLLYAGIEYVSNELLRFRKIRLVSSHLRIRADAI